MRVLFSVPRYHPNHDGMVLGLLNAGHEVDFLVQSVSETEKHLAGAQVQVIPRSVLDALILKRGLSGQQIRSRSIPSLRFLYRHLRSARPDVIVARNLSTSNYLLFLLSRMLGLNYLLYVQSREGFERLTRSGPALLRAGLWPRHTLGTTTETPTIKIPGKTYDFVPFAMETYDFGKRTYSGGLPVQVLAVGKLDQERKHHVPLVRALAPMLRAGEVRLTILGLLNKPDGPAFRALLDEIAAQGVEDSVRILKNLPYDAARRLYEAHDLFVMASRRETAGIAPVEAMASGLAVITSSDTGTRYFVLPGETGFIFEDRDFEDLAARVRHFVRNPTELERMGRNGRARIIAHFSPAAFERRFTDLVARRFPEVDVNAPRG